MEPALARHIVKVVLVACLVLTAGILGWYQGGAGRRAREADQPAVGGMVVSQPERITPQGRQLPAFGQAQSSQSSPQRVTSPSSVAARGGGRTGLEHQVQPGETLYRISKQYGVSVSDLKHANGFTTDRIVPGQRLLVPGERAVSQTAVGGAFAWPVPAPVSSYYGERWGRMHRGLDLAANQGDPIRASRDGVVLVAGTVPGYGQTVILSHQGGSRTLYGHSSKLLVSQGQRVRQGQAIALVGSTGNSTGPHLHFEIIINDQPIDPLLHLPGR